MINEKNKKVTRFPKGNSESMEGFKIGNRYKRTLLVGKRGKPKRFLVLIIKKVIIITTLINKIFNVLAFLFELKKTSKIREMRSEFIEFSLILSLSYLIRKNSVTRTPKYENETISKVVLFLFCFLTFVLIEVASFFSTDNCSRFNIYIYIKI